MDIDTVIHDREVLNEVLRNALSTMEKKDTVKKTRLQLLELQNNCPHFSTKYNWVMTDDICPYCGKKLE